MAKPQEEDWCRVKRLARYLMGRPRLIQKFAWQVKPKWLSVFTDANWGGCKKTRRSTSAGCVMNGKHTIKSWSKTQATVATSSAEAELYAVARGTQEAMASLTMLREFNIIFTAKLFTVASAALAISQREGLGKLKHINVQWLWIQDISKRGMVWYHKVAGSENPADAMTKYLTKAIVDKHLAAMKYHFGDGQAECALKVASNIV